MSSGGRTIRWAGSILALGVLAACDAELTSPGAIHDEELNRPEAQQGLVTGMGRALSSALNYVAQTGSLIAGEIAFAGNNSITFGFSDRQQRGILDPGDEETAPHWERAQQARWVAEDGVRRLREVLGETFSSSPVAARALLYAGYANRLLGENMCEAVIDGGPAQPRQVSFERAEAAFSEALDVAGAAVDQDLELAAHAGRAAARIGLGNWAGAVEDARAVPDGFVFQATYSEIELEQYNRIYWSNANRPYRSHTVWSTFYEDYYLETGDPRTPWSSDPEVPTGQAGVTWHFQTKYDSRSSPINLSSGSEMRLIEAEALLRGGDVAGALAIVNSLRASAGVPPWEAETPEEAWTALKRERGIALWLEGRRLWDLHRWLEEHTPGASEDVTSRDTCFPIGRTEVDSNPNVDRRPPR
jgi:hypothetical protein